MIGNSREDRVEVGERDTVNMEGGTRAQAVWLWGRGECTDEDGVQATLSDNPHGV